MICQVRSGLVRQGFGQVAIYKDCHNVYVFSRGPLKLTCGRKFIFINYYVINILFSLLIINIFCKFLCLTVRQMGNIVNKKIMKKSRVRFEAL
jgi:hypothetical protein